MNSPPVSSFPLLLNIVKRLLQVLTNLLLSWDQYSVMLSSNSKREHHWRKETLILIFLILKNKSCVKILANKLLLDMDIGDIYQVYQKLSILWNWCCLYLFISVYIHNVQNFTILLFLYFLPITTISIKTLLNRHSVLSWSMLSFLLCGGYDLMG